MNATRTSSPLPLGVEPISLQRIYQEVASQLRRNIRDGKLRPGDKLPPERTLAQLFGVSRNTMREALRALELSGLIELKLGSAGGAFILHGGSDAVVNGLRDLSLLGAITPAHLAEARLALGAAVIRTACERSTAADLEALEHNLALATQADKAGDADQRTRHQQAFHVLLAKATHNPILSATFEGIVEIARQSTQQAGPTDDDPSALPAHRRLLKLLRDRDAEKAIKEMAAMLTRLYHADLAKARARPAAGAPGRPEPVAPRRGSSPGRTRSVVGPAVQRPVPVKKRARVPRAT